MRALLRTLPGTPVWTVLEIVTLCLIIGASIPVFASIMGDQLSRLAALPAFLLLGVLLIYYYK